MGLVPARLSDPYVYLTVVSQDDPASDGDLAFQLSSQPTSSHSQLTADLPVNILQVTPSTPPHQQSHLISGPKEKTANCTSRREEVNKNIVVRPRNNNLCPLDSKINRSLSNVHKASVMPKTCAFLRLWRGVHHFLSI